MEYCQEIISGKRCHIFTRGEQGPVIYWGIAAGSGSMAEKTARMLADADGGDFLLAVYEAEDWNRDFSPWPGRPSTWILSPGTGAAGGGSGTSPIC